MVFMNKRRIIYSVLAILFGAFIFVYGGRDDSPGAQLLGLLAVIAGIVSIIKSRKKLPIKPGSRTGGAD
jgi:drug/metabolite transporter (DMT)-like permease